MNINDSYNLTIRVVSLPQDLLTQLLTNCARILRFSALFYHFMNQPSTSLPLPQQWYTLFEIIYKTKS